ncbi:MAG: DUF2807 domain-containing protein [Flavobacteriaceae bacterium]|jgi:hypothetical protein|nr:DUF2807 domain-containing protein [Flavobacteriaceae bacterium]
MKQILLFLLPLVVTLYSCDFSIKKGEGAVGDKEVKLSPNIKQISAKGNYRIVFLYDSINPRMVIESYQNVRDNIKMSNAGGELTLSESRNVENIDLYNIYIYLSEIEQVKLYDNVNMDVNSQFRLAKLNIKLKDKAKFLANSLVVENLTVKVNDKAKINLQGEGTNLNLTASSGSDFSAPFYETANATIELSGVSTAEINVKSKLTGKISNNSELTLIGNPAKEIKQTDLAKITQK